MCKLANKDKMMVLGRTDFDTVDLERADLR